MREVILKIKELKEKIAKTWQILDLDKTQVELRDLEKQSENPDFWQDQKKAIEINQKIDELREEIQKWEQLKKEVDDLLELAELDKEDKDVNLRQEIEAKLAQLEKKFAKLEFFVLLDQKYDRHNAIMSIHAGTGGVDAQDWAAILLRMYLRYAEKRGWLVKIVDKSMGQEAGIKRVTLEIKGNWAYGFLKSEAGVHRLVRISPFDAEKMRHTSFALVEVLPELEIEEEEIEEEDLKIDTFRASGPGGQGVNTTDSAVRITHLPTKISVVCQNERSQFQNKETALKILRSKLHNLYLKQQQEKKAQIRGEVLAAEWGNQIRSYVLHPYKMVKDHRTKYEVSEVERVLDGEIDDFIEAYLRKQRK